MQDFTFTGLYEQTPGNPLVTFIWSGVSPVDALMRQWAMAPAEITMATPLRCEADGHVYHLRLNEDGHREIKVLAVAQRLVVADVAIN